MYGIIRASNLCAMAATWPGYQVILIAVIKSEAGRGVCWLVGPVASSNYARRPCALGASRTLFRTELS